MRNAPIVVPLAIGAFIFTLTETAVMCTRRNLSTVGYNARALSVRFETQPWISVIEAFPAFYLTGYIQYITMCCVTKL